MLTDSTSESRAHVLGLSMDGCSSGLDKALVCLASELILAERSGAITSV